MTNIRPGHVAALGNERGSTIVFVSLAMVALLSMVAMAVDVGMLLTARGEAQRAADGAALAGVTALISRPDDEAHAREVAIEIGEMNTFGNQNAEILPEDVEVDLDLQTVRVTVRRSTERDNPVATWFARVFGIDEVDVSAVATAEATPAGSAVCVKPFAIPDRFNDVNGNNIFDPGQDSYDPLIHGYGTSWRNPGSPGDDGEGFINDYGREVDLKAGGPGADTPSWYRPWDVPQTLNGECTGGPIGQGADCYEWAITNCHPAIISVGQEYQVATGGMTGKTRTGVEGLRKLDEGATWDPFNLEIDGSNMDPNWEASKRIGIIPYFDPSRPFDPGNRPIKFTGFIAVFFHKPAAGLGVGQGVKGIVLYPVGILGGDGDTESTTQAPHLIE